MLTRSLPLLEPITDSELRTVFTSVNLTSCELDPLPPFLIVEFIDDLSPFFLYLFNRSLAEGCIPALQKHTLVSPALKKPTLEPSLCSNFRPIHNLSFLSKTLERLIAIQILPCLESSGFLPSYQSRFRNNHSTETLLLSMLADILSAIDKSQVSLPAMFDVSSAFDMVVHKSLLQRLECVLLQPQGYTPPLASILFN